jgi:protein-tyrosine phosphatase
LQRELFYGVIFIAIAASLGWLAAQGGVWLLHGWPSLSFGAVSVAYLTGSTRIFGKRADGSRHWLATLVIGPYLMLASCVWRIQIILSREAAFNTVNDVLIVARRLLASELPQDINHVCDLTCEFRDPKELRELPGYKCFPVLDAGTLSADDLVAIVKELPSEKDGRLLIHCANGHGRTGLIAAAWLISNNYAASVDDAVAALRAVRPGISLRKRQRASLHQAFPLLKKLSQG